MTDHAAIIAKIRKCLALSKSANEHEAAAALAKAHALMAEHNITTEAVALADVSTARTKARNTSRIPEWQSMLITTIWHVFQVYPLLAVDPKTRCNEIIWIGVGPAAEVAAYAYQVVDRKIRADRKTYLETILKRSKAKTARADAYCLGWINAIAIKVKHLWSQEAPEVVGQWLDINYPNLKSPVSVTRRKAPSSVASEDMCRGYLTGREHDLNHGVGSAATQRQLEARS